ncbi:hypothetical protein [Wielerella bovis]|uniref:hypothetical protein n=1 Tax=Wielerella bovis TaxID=2917790 RepID=UPI00201847A3|nr:hypothetical protein [Wielerella bovis]ULJ59786.1 hypothetical protein MIS44_08890 [Wielerella bovis]
MFKILKTPIFIVIFLLITSQFTEYLFIFAPIILISRLFGFVSAARKKSLWISQIIKTLLWLTAFIGVYMWHNYHASERLAQANQIAQQIQRFQATHHRYPNQSELFGNQQKYTEQQRIIIYLPPEKQRPYPLLAYRSTTNPFDKYVYDFEKQEWQFRPD